MSPAQRAVWLVHQVKPDCTAYHITEAFYLSGQISLPALTSAFDMLIARHEILRTTFGLRDNQPVQILDAARSCHLVTVDLTAKPAEWREYVCQQALREIATRPYNLATGPLLRAALFQLAGQKWMLIFGMHHIIFDAWSAKIFYDELTALYAAEADGAVAGVPELPIQYVDYAMWHRDWFTGTLRQQQVDFWRSQLALPPQPLPASSRARRSVSISHDAHSIEICILPTVARQLRTIGQRFGASLFMVTLACFQLMLSQLSRRDDIVVGIPVNGRYRVELEYVIGLFGNIIPIRTMVNKKDTLAHVVAAARDSVIEGLANADLPLDEIMKLADVGRTPGMNPLVQVLFQLLDDEDPPVPEFAGVVATPISMTVREAVFDFGIDIHTQEGGLRGYLISRSDVVSINSLIEMHDTFQSILASLISDPTRLASSLAPRD